MPKGLGSCCTSSGWVEPKPRWQMDGYKSMDACIGDNTTLTTLTGLVMGIGAQATSQAASLASKAASGLIRGAATTISTYSNAIGWAVVGITAADYAAARSHCNKSTCRNSGE